MLVVMSAKGESTAQPHVLIVRKELERLLPDPMDTITPIVPAPGDEKGWDAALKELRRIEKTTPGKGWRFSDRKPGGGVGMLACRFDVPIQWMDVEAAMIRAMRNAGYTAATSRMIAAHEQGKSISESGDGVGKSTKGHKPGDIIAGHMELLTRTSKMGCYSWNIPAGPVKYGGSCPGANMLFDTKGIGLPGTDPLSGVRAMAALRRSKNRALAQYAKEVPLDQKDALQRFICNGCYALKGSYGNPSTILSMTWKKVWLKKFALPTGQFRSIMVQAITMSRRKVTKERKKAKTPEKLAAIPHPDYFRIHDAGDFWSSAYLNEWFEICRMLPDVHFWAPTRIWTATSTAKWLERMVANDAIPKNLSLRPSGLFFDAPEPQVPGLDGGTSSNSITFNVRSGRIRLDIHATGEETWGCPAYLPEVIGGGAAKTTLTDKQILEAKGKRVFGAKGFQIEGRRNAYVMHVMPALKKYEGTFKAKEIKGKTIEELDAKLDRVLAQLAGVIQENPTVPKQAYAMYPKIDDATLERKDYVFYDALYDKKAKRFIIDPETGRPMRATRENMKAHPSAIVLKSQAYQAAGSCSVARDPHKAAECRVCWGTSAGKRKKTMKRLPVVYGKH